MNARDGRQKVPSKSLNLLSIVTLAALLGACNTTRGLGEDVEAVGEGIEEAADEAEEEIDD